jgi:Leucine-rich repeat (LRR) protein
MKKSVFTILSLMLITSVNVQANPTCESIADADQQFITDLCEANGKDADSTGHLRELCGKDFILTTKSAAYQKSISYKAKQGDRSSGYGDKMTYEQLQHYPVAFSMTCTEEGMSFETLVINSEGLTKIPESIGGLTQLRVLDLSDNEIVYVPATISQNKILEQVYLGGNKIPQIPQGLDSLPNLRTLYLNQNEIYSVDVPTVEALLQRVDYFDLTENRLSPEQRKELKQKYRRNPKLSFI